jgi:membrane peptidoglycan carboxypeptidase
MDVGTDKVRDAAVDAGLNKDQLAALSPTFSLGTSAPSAIRLAGAYATFAASGEQVDPYSVSKVEREGQERFVYDGAKKQAFESAVADNVTDVLRTVVEKGTGTSAQIGRPAAGKTGTTDDNKSAWFAGFTPQLATSIGMFRVDDRAAQQKFLPMYGVGGKETIHGASFPAEIWADYMKQALANEPVKDFPVPQPIGEKVNGYGASPSPSPSPSQSPTQQPSETPSTGPSRAPTKRPKPSDSCDPSDWACLTTGGTSDGGTTGETITSSPTATDTSGNGNGNGNGSLFGGPTG